MKTIAIYVMSSLLLAGCSKKNTDPTPANPTGSTGTASTLSANVTGYPAVSYTSPTGALNTDVSAARIASSDPAATPYILYIYSGTNTKGIRLVVNKFTGPGTYALLSNYNGSLPAQNSAVYADGTTSFGTSAVPGSGATLGQVVVSSFDAATHRVKGTFQFTASSVAIPPATGQTRQVTDGAFDINVTL